MISKDQLDNWNSEVSYWKARAQSTQDRCDEWQKRAEFWFVAFLSAGLLALIWWVL